MLFLIHTACGDSISWPFYHHTASSRLQKGSSYPVAPDPIPKTEINKKGHLLNLQEKRTHPLCRNITSFYPRYADLFAKRVRPFCRKDPNFPQNRAVSQPESSCFSLFLLRNVVENDRFASSKACKPAFRSPERSPGKGKICQLVMRAFPFQTVTHLYPDA